MSRECSTHVVWDLDINERIITYLRTELSPSGEATIQKIPSNFKEPEGSSPCSQEPSTGPYHPIGLFPSGFSTNILYAWEDNINLK
jgi:hypothetical protein